MLRRLQINSPSDGRIGPQASRCLLSRLRADFKIGLKRVLIANPQQVLPLAIVAFEAQALGNPKGRDQTSFDLLSTFTGVIAR